MSIAHYIQQEVLLPRARDARVLVVYDAERRYRDLCLSLANDELRVVDASESSIEKKVLPLVRPSSSSLPLVSRKPSANLNFQSSSAAPQARAACRVAGSSRSRRSPD